VWAGLVAGLAVVALFLAVRLRAMEVRGVDRIRA